MSRIPSPRNSVRNRLITNNTQEVPSSWPLLTPHEIAAGIRLKDIELSPDKISHLLDHKAAPVAEILALALAASHGTSRPGSRASVRVNPDVRCGGPLVGENRLDGVGSGNVVGLRAGFGDVLGEGVVCDAEELIHVRIGHEIRVAQRSSNISPVKRPFEGIVHDNLQMRIPSHIFDGLICMHFELSIS